MTALAYTNVTAPIASDATSIDAGQGLEMFSSGSAPVSCDMTSGGGVALFTTSVLSTSAEIATGDKTGLFTTSV